MKIETVILPAAWAGGLVNGEWSGLEFDDPDGAAKAKQWQMENNLNIVSCSEESFVSQYDGKLTDMLEYQAHVQ